jgi:non-canonical purine NTP pyrophosphatase (RdgB/HAM1 family)
MDTALSLDCLNGFPGPFIKWYYEKSVGAEKTCQIAKLFNQFGCQFTTTLGYFDGKNTHFITEKVEGLIPDKPRGTNGYHWDIIFIPKGENRTFAEMSFEEKQNFAVTNKIFKRFREILSDSKS